MKTEEIRRLFEDPRRRRRRRRPSFRRAVLALLAFGVVGVITTIALVAVNRPDPLAELRVRKEQVTLHHPDRTNEVARDGDALVEGDIVRTDARGSAQIDLADESVIRLDKRSDVALKDLEREGRVIVELHGGRTWNRVTDRSASFFEVRMPTGSARVVGTTFIADCRRQISCYVIGIEGSTAVTANGERKTVRAGGCMELRGSGLRKCDERKLALLDAWVTENLAEDQQLQVRTVEGTPVPTTPTDVPRRTRRPVFRAPAPAASAVPDPTPKPAPKETRKPNEDVDPATATASDL